MTVVLLNELLLHVCLWVRVSQYFINLTKAERDFVARLLVGSNLTISYNLIGVERNFVASLCVGSNLTMFYKPN
jgi:hypothetical protein